MTDVKVVAPMNMGKGIIWNDITKTYEVNIGNGLEINSEGKVVVKELITNPKELITNPVSTKIVDKVTAAVIGEQYTIDYGNGLIEVNCLLEFPLVTYVTHGEYYPNKPVTIGMFSATCSVSGYRDSDSGEMLYPKKSVTTITAEELGMSKILSVSSMPCNIDANLSKNAWAGKDNLFTSNVRLGVNTTTVINENKLKALFQIKGFKA